MPTPVLETYDDLAVFVTRVLGSASASAQLLSARFSRAEEDLMNRLDDDLDADLVELRTALTGLIFDDAFQRLRGDREAFSSVMEVLFPVAGRLLLDPLSPAPFSPVFGGSADYASALVGATLPRHGELGEIALRQMLLADPSLCGSRRVEAGRVLFEHMGPSMVLSKVIDDWVSGRDQDRASNALSASQSPCRGRPFLDRVGIRCTSMRRGRSGKSYARRVWSLGLQPLVVEYLTVGNVRPMKCDLGGGISTVLSPEEIRKGPYLSSFLAAGRGRSLGSQVEQGVTVGGGLAPVPRVSSRIPVKPSMDIFGSGSGSRRLVDR